MIGAGGSGLPSGVHGDVMNAHPTDAEGKQRLVDEVKARSKSILGSSKNYMEARSLYTKGIEVMPGDATLFGNRSMCHLNMGNKKLALEDAAKAIELDATYAKAYYRKAMAEIAMDDYLAAHASLQENLKLAPGDKAVEQQIAKVQTLLDQQKANGGVAKPVATTPAAVPKARSTVPVSTTAKATPPPAAPTPPATSTPSPKPATSSPAPPAPAASEPVVDPSNGGKNNMRGYKITSDGRKTSYFTNELDEQTKQLIGDIRPKKLEPAAATNVPAPTAVAVDAPAVWNSAGTFEERNATPWAKECLQKHLEKIEFKLPDIFPHPAGGAAPTGSAMNLEMAHLDVYISVSKVKSVTGDASVMFNRGKKKYLADFTAECEWKLEGYDSKLMGIMALAEQAGAGGECVKPPLVIGASGSITINDVTAAGEDDAEMNVEGAANSIKNNSNGAISKTEILGLVNKHIKAPGSSGTASKTVGTDVDKLEVAVKRAIKQFADEFKMAK